MTTAIIRVRNAKDAVRFFWDMRGCLPDTSEVAEALQEIRDVSRTAKAERRRITDHEWIALAEAVDDACDEDGLPRLFNTEGA